MAAGMMSAPGTEYGPCLDECQHRDCAATRARAASACLMCGVVIGYDRPFFVLDDGPAHALCVWST